MSKREKLIEKFCRKPPPTDFRFDDLITLLAMLGFEMFEKSGGSSHKYFVLTRVNEEDLRLDCCRPHPSGILKIYQIKEVHAFLKLWELI